MSFWHYCKLVQEWGASGNTASNDHAGDFISLNNGALIYKDASIPQPTTSTVYPYEVVFFIECIRKPRIPLSDFRFWSVTSAPDVPNNKVLVYVGTANTYSNPINTLSTKAIYRQDTTYYSSANSLVIPGTLSNIGDKTKLIYLQLRVAIGAGKIERLNIPMHFKFNQGGG